MRNQLQNLRTQALSQILDASSKEELEEIRSKLLGKRGEINELTKQISGLDQSEKIEIGKLINEIKDSISDAIENSPLNQANTAISESEIDSTLPGILPPIGHLHPVTYAID